jgi:hypothetical protein
MSFWKFISSVDSLAISTNVSSTQEEEITFSIMQKDFECNEGEEEVDRLAADRAQINESLPQIPELLPTEKTTILHRFVCPILTLIFVTLTVHHLVKLVTPENAVAFALKSWNKEMVPRGMMPIKADETIMILKERSQNVMGDILASGKCPDSHSPGENCGIVIGRRLIGTFNYDTKCHNVTRVVVSACSGGRCAYCSGLFHDSSEKVVKNHLCGLGITKQFENLQWFGMKHISLNPLKLIYSRISLKEVTTQLYQILKDLKAIVN